MSGRLSDVSLTVVLAAVLPPSRAVSEVDSSPLDRYMADVSS